MNMQIIITGLAGVAATLSIGNAAAQSARMPRPVAVQPPVAEVGAPLPAPRRKPDAPVSGPATVSQIQPGAATKRAYPAYKCWVGILNASEKAKNPNLAPTFVDVEFLPFADDVYHSTGVVHAFNQFSFRMIENAGVIEFKVNGTRADYVKVHGEISASWIQPVKWTLATGNIEGYYTQYWFGSGVSGRCRVK